jgi:hypothetical protein
MLELTILDIIMFFSVFLMGSCISILFSVLRVGKKSSLLESERTVKLIESLSNPDHRIAETSKNELFKIFLLTFLRGEEMSTLDKILFITLLTGGVPNREMMNLLIQRALFEKGVPISKEEKIERVSKEALKSIAKEAEKEAKKEVKEEIKRRIKEKLLGAG